MHMEIMNLTSRNFYFSADESSSRGYDSSLTDTVSAGLTSPDLWFSGFSHTDLTRMIISLSILLGGVTVLHLVCGRRPSIAPGSRQTRKFSRPFLLPPALSPPKRSNSQQLRNSDDSGLVHTSPVLNNRSSSDDSHQGEKNEDYDEDWFSLEDEYFDELTITDAPNSHRSSRLGSLSFPVMEDELLPRSSSSSASASSSTSSSSYSLFIPRRVQSVPNTSSLRD